MSVIPPEHPIPVVAPGDYVITEKPSVDDPLHAPSHSGLHNKTSDMVQKLNDRVTVVERNINLAWPQVDAARLAAHQWTVPGSLWGVPTLQLLLPIVWNGSDHPVLFSAAKATVYDKADRDIKVNLYTGFTLDGGGLNTDLATSILMNPLTIPANALTSPTYTYAEGHFRPNSFHDQGAYVAAVIESVGTEDLPGADLTFKLDELL